VDQAAADNGGKSAALHKDNDTRLKNKGGVLTPDPFGTHSGGGDGSGGRVSKRRRLPTGSLWTDSLVRFHSGASRRLCAGASSARRAQPAWACSLDSRSSIGSSTSFWADPPRLQPHAPVYHRARRSRLVSTFIAMTVGGRHRAARNICFISGDSRALRPTEARRFTIPFVLFHQHWISCGVASRTLFFPYMNGVFRELRPSRSPVHAEVGRGVQPLYERLLGMASCFQMPTVVFFLSKAGLVTARRLWRSSVAPLLIFIVAAVITRRGTCHAEASCRPVIVSTRLVLRSPGWSAGRAVTPATKANTEVCIPAIRPLRAYWRRRNGRAAEDARSRHAIDCPLPPLQSRSSRPGLPRPHRRTNPKDFLSAPGRQRFNRSARRGLPPQRERPIGPQITCSIVC